MGIPKESVGVAEEDLCKNVQSKISRRSPYFPNWVSEDDWGLEEELEEEERAFEERLEEVV